MHDEWTKLPEKFLERLQQIIPDENKQDVLLAFCVKRPYAIRTNILKISAGVLAQKLKELGIPVKQIPWYHDAFILHNNLQLVMETELYKKGYFYIQNLSSMIPALILDPKPDEKILDIAAAPGSKTTQIAAIMENQGGIVANDISTARLYKLKMNLQIQGITNTKVTKMPGQMLWKKYPEYFDKVLVDVPCSMEGRFYCSDPKSYKDWTFRKVKVLAKLERYLLRSAVSSTKPGGIIVYSTCTLSPEENEEVIDWILSKEKTALEIERIDIQGLQSNAPILQWKNKSYNIQIKNTLRILPSKTMEGFYIAKIHKLHSTL